LTFPIHIAAIDAGSNAIRLVIARAESPTSIHELATERAPVRLGHRAFTRRRLDEDTMERAVKAFRGFRELMDLYRVEAWRAVATSACREARNSAEMIRRIERKTGIRLEIVSGQEEARLVRTAVLSTCDGRFDPGVILDLGGGSLEVNLLRAGQIRKSVNLPVGTVRLMETLGIDGRISGQQRELIHDVVDHHLGHFLRGVPRVPFGVAAACGGNVEALTQIFRGAPASGMETLDLRLLRRRLSELTGRDVAERMRRYRIRRDRADVIAIAALILDAAAEMLGLRTLIVPGVGVREGVLRALLASRFAAAISRKPADRTDQRAAEARAGVSWFAQRFQFDAPHAQHVAALALSLFDQLRPVHGLDGQARLALELGALLHDVGRFISDRSHHRHGEYLVRYGEIPGLSEEMRQLVGCLVRYHNHKSEPDPDHRPYGDLPRETRRRIRLLAALLRVAEGLDAGHQRSVGDVRALYRIGRVEFEIGGKGDLTEAVAAAQKRAGLFEREFGVTALFRRPMRREGQRVA
jgi:exopolyphosphatase/guanosine-5'-triphosphate,3'-diphosphate pyrophosphatase